MLREEAEREAERRNHEEPDRARYEFYAFDESAAWPRTRGTSPRACARPASTTEWPGLGPQTPAGGAPPPAPPRRAEPVEEPLVLEGPNIAETDPFAGPDPFVEPLPYQEPLPHEETLPTGSRARTTGAPGCSFGPSAPS